MTLMKSFSQRFCKIVSDLNERVKIRKCYSCLKLMIQTHIFYKPSITKTILWIHEIFATNISFQTKK